MDPRVTVPYKQKADLSPLRQAQLKASEGQKVNACPFGCGEDLLDDHGYCRHLVGFTNDGKTMEPMVEVKPGKRRVQGEPQKVLPSDTLVRITVSSRVYRDVDAAKKQTA